MARLKNYQIKKTWEYPQNDDNVLNHKDLSATFCRLLAARGLKTDLEIESFINPKYEKLTSPFEIPDMEMAATRIIKAINNKENIVIYGDYDVDGITATALLVDFFEQVGASVSSYIPSRHTEGYGLNDEAIKTLAEGGAQLVITVDCGTSSFGEIELANSLGLDIVVTDHHSLKQGMLLPNAIAVVNPQRIVTDSPLKLLAGVGVAFYLVRAIVVLNKDILAEGQEKWFLDLVALGTVCDIVPLLSDNRILVYYGLKVFSRTKRAGFRALAEATNTDIKSISSYDMGFGFGPRLNAAGRLEHAKRSLELLLTKSDKDAQDIANELDALNKERQELTERIVTEAKAIIDAKGSEDKVHLLSDASWPAGVVGIVASRLVEDYGKPVLVMEDFGDVLKGSARSINGFNIIEALSECSDIFTHFGGHAFAAGFALPKDKFVLLNDKLLKISADHFELNDIKTKIDVDLDVLCKDIDKKLISEVELLAPFGKDNPKPIFSMSGCEIVEAKLVGNPAVHLKLGISQNNCTMRGIAFGWGETLAIKNDKQYNLAINFDINNFNGRSNVEFRVIDIAETI